MSTANAENTGGPAHLSVALVGAGPRGTSVLERLCASAPSLLPPGTRLTVHVVDPAPPGPGRVWRADQSPELLMNTVASQVTLFTDDSVDCSGPIRPGPSLHEWAGGDLGPDDYPARAHYGRYLEWVFAEVVRQAPPGVRVETHPARAVRLTDGPDGRQELALDDGRELTGLAAVVLAQGHLPATADAEQRRLTSYAAAHGLRHIPPANPADVDLSGLAPGEPVLLRGLGLNFFDHIALLTTGRGGRFLRGGREGRELRYVPSGREPRLYAGSRRGVPYQARGDNAKGPYGRHTPLVLTPEVVSGFRKRADSGTRRTSWRRSGHWWRRRWRRCTTRRCSGGPRSPTGSWPPRTGIPQRPGCSTSSGCRRARAGPGSEYPGRTGSGSSPMPVSGGPGC
ncbi:hypothetical protein SGLAM104S_10107 [Streptomyces glaucescens]